MKGPQLKLPEGSGGLLACTGSYYVDLNSDCLAGIESCDMSCDYHMIFTCTVHQLDLIIEGKDTNGRALEIWLKDSNVSKMSVVSDKLLITASSLASRPHFLPQQSIAC